MLYKYITMARIYPSVNQTSTLSRVENRDDHIWVDINIEFNRNDLFKENSTRAFYSSTKTESIVNNPSLYHLMIDRFSIPGFLLPSYIHDPDQPGSVTLGYDGNFANVNLFFDSRSDLPNTDEEYYYIYNFEHWVFMVNSALKNAFTLLGGLVALPAGSKAPYLYWNSVTQRFEFFAQQAFYDYQNLLNPIQVFLSPRIYFQLPFFPYYSTDSGSWQLLFTDNNENIVQRGSPAESYIQMIQEASGVSYWNPVKSIVFVSNTIPVKNTYTNINNALQTSQDSNSSSLAILTDFVLNITNSLDQRKTLIYVPNQDFRRLDLYGTSPLRQLDIQVYWTDKDNKIHPVRIPVKESVNIKILFVKKTSLD